MNNTNQTSGAGPASYAGATVYDKVEVTPSGHRRRTNDEAGHEEISTTHTVGTYEIWGPSGERSLKVVGHNYTAYHSGTELVVEGACNITVMGDCNLNVGPKEDPNTGEKSGGNFKVEAENIYLNSRKSTNISAGTDIKIETRSTSEDRKEPGGNIDIISANAYQLKVFGEATETFEKSLETKIIKAFDLTINGDYKIVVTGGSKDDKGEEYDGDMITRVKGQASIIAKNKLKLVSKDKTIIAANDDIKIRSKETGNIDLNSQKDITFNSDEDTVFNSQSWNIESGPVHIVPTVDTDKTITADGQIKSNDDVIADNVLEISLKNHIHTADGDPEVPGPTSKPLPT
jgi:hypothetical protein